MTEKITISTTAYSPHLAGGHYLTPIHLRRWIDRMGFSDREAARQLGCSRAALAHWLAGETPIPHYIGLAMSALAHGLRAWQYE